MMTKPRELTLTHAYSLALLLTLATGGCTNQSPGRNADAHTDKKVFSGIRGVVVGLPYKEDPRLRVCQTTRPIVSISGPENADPAYSSLATMPFWLSPNAEKLRLRDGDKISFDLETDWDTDTPVLITSISIDEKDRNEQSGCP
jgi:hypothetical protein